MRPGGQRSERVGDPKTEEELEDVEDVEEIEAASSGVLSISLVTRSRWKSYIIRPAKVTNPSSA